MSPFPTFYLFYLQKMWKMWVVSMMSKFCQYNQYSTIGLQYLHIMGSHVHPTKASWSSFANQWKYSNYIDNSLNSFTLKVQSQFVLFNFWLLFRQDGNSCLWMRLLFKNMLSHNHIVSSRLSFCETNDYNNI